MSRKLFAIAAISSAPFLNPQTVFPRTDKLRDDSSLGNSYIDDEFSDPLAESQPALRHFAPSMEDDDGCYLTAVIDGNSLEFASAEDKFHALVAEVLRQRESGSSTALFLNSAYGQIVGMGPTAIPFLLDEIKKQTGHWSTALTWITGYSPVTSKMRGNIRAIREAWIQWGVQHGFDNSVV